MSDNSIQTQKISLKKVTIVTVTRNAEVFVEKTIKSVLGQDYSAIEYIIVDGNSTDQTKAIISKYIDEIDVFISEPDRGIYDAMNKGANLATGEWIIYMNAGDTFYDCSSISKISDFFTTDADVICAGAEKILVDELQTRHFQVYPGNIDQIWKQMPTVHQATIVRTTCQKEYKFDASYQWCGDHQMLARMYSDEKKFVMANSLFCYFDCSGSQSRSHLIYIKERWQLSKGIVPLYVRLAYYGREYFIYLIFKPIIDCLKLIVPPSIILKIRQIRRTSGINA